ncbi:protein OS-9 homolog [Zingiber officinale]|uniref:protein OS-9 homolog n=1 Tax=Zingiber officinale TaxID=94328 RepID=UPI001C4C0AFA|nr:protein OS-9 homolog [Zingiber officinale]
MALARSLCGSILLLHLLGAVFLGSILADQIYTGSGGRFGRSSREPKYKVEFHPENSPFYPVVGQEEVAMSNKEGKNYNCYLPIVEETKVLKTVTHENSSSLIMESEQKIKFKTPDELIEGLKDADRCFYRFEGWWTYEFCSHKHVKQLHIEDEKAVEEFVLGKFDADATSVFNENHSDTFTVKDPRSKDASQRYHAHQYTNGTMCDLTNQPRETEVRFVCSEQSAVISSIKEAATCKYVVTIQCSLLCKHPMFQQERPMWHTIHCNEMGGDSKDSSVEDGPKVTKAPT